MNALKWQYNLTRKFSPPKGDFFLAHAEGKGPLGPRVILPDIRSNRFKGVRYVTSKLYICSNILLYVPSLSLFMYDVSEGGGGGKGFFNY